MSRLPEPFTILLPEDWTPEQAWAVQDCLDELLVQIQARYGAAVQQWLYGEDTDPDPDPPPDARRPTPSPNWTSSRTTSTIRCPSERPSPGGSPSAGRRPRSRPA